jgi:hypothetical protein
LVGYESKYWNEAPWAVNRQGVWDSENSDFMENFDFANNNNIAFASINVPGGVVNTDGNSDATNQEFMTREKANYNLIAASYSYYLNQADALVIFMNDALPGSNVANRLFYTILMEQIRDSYSDMNFIFVFRMSSIDKTGGHWFGYNYNNIPNLAVVSVAPNGPPLRLIIESNGQDTMPNIRIDINWYYELWGIKNN